MLTQQNIEAELSYAYLHAVASRGGFSCEVSNRHMDSAAVDAIVREDGKMLASDSVLTSFEVHVQLKATYQPLVDVGGRWAFSLPVHQYNRLRAIRVGSPKLLMVMQLPSTVDDWLRHSEDGLTAKRCGYWVSLRGAPESPNDRTQTIYIPRSQLLSPDALMDLMTRFSRREAVNYEP